MKTGSKVRILTMTGKPKATILRVWSPPGWMEIINYDVRLARTGEIIKELKNWEIRSIK